MCGRLTWVACLIGLIFSLSACPRRPADPVELLAEVAEPATLELLRAAGEQALMVVLVRPAAWAEDARALGEALRGVGLEEAERVLATPDLWAAAGELAGLLWGRRPAGLQGPLPGWDASRPVVLALFEPVVDDAVLAGRALMLEAASRGTTGLRHRVLVPATDSRALLGGLLEALSALGLEADSEARALAVLQGGQLLRLPGGEASLVALIPEARFLRVEILQEDTRVFASPEARLGAVSAWLARPGSPGPQLITPARLFVSSSQDLLSVWLRPWQLRDLGGQVGTSKVAQAVAYADPSYRAMLLAVGLAEVSQGTLVMDPRGAEIDDLAWSLSARSSSGEQTAPGMRMRGVLSLTELGARVWAKGLEGGARLPAAELPQASLSAWLRFDLAAAVAEAEPPPGLADVEDLSELARRVQECGAFCLLHLGLRAPVGLLKTVWRFLPPDMPLVLPRGLALAVGPLPPGLAAPPALALVASLPVGVNLPALERAVGELREGGLRQGLGILWRSEIRPEDTRVFFGLNESAERVFVGPEPGAPDGLLGELRLDLRGLADGLQREAPEVSTVLARLGTLRGQSWQRGRLLQGELIVGGAGGRAERPWLAEGAALAWASPGAKEAAGRGAVCLAEVTRDMTEAFRALAAVAPDQKALMLARAMEESSRHLPCALGDPGTRAEAARLQRSLYLAAADLHEAELREDGLGQILDAGCRQGVEEACARRAALAKRPRVDLPRVESRCGEGLQGLAVVRVPASGPVELPEGKGPFVLAADRTAPAGAVLDALRTLGGRGAREVTLAVDGPGGPRGVQVELAAGLAPASAVEPPPGPAGLRLDGRPAEAPVGMERLVRPDRFEDSSASPEEPGSRPACLDPGPDQPWQETVAEIARLACGQEARARSVVLGPVDPARCGLATALMGVDPAGSLSGSFEGALGGLGTKGGGLRSLGAGTKEDPVRVELAGPDAPLLTGPMPKEIIRRVIRQHQKQVRYCYEKALVKNPKLAGTLKIKFTIGPKGAVTQASVEADSVGSEALAGCVQKTVQRMKFPAPKGGGIVVVRYPFVFKTAE
jgi:TonB family protein